jgi:hypothetical protein
MKMTIWCTRQFITVTADVFEQQVKMLTPYPREAVASIPAAMYRNDTMSCQLRGEFR